MHVAVHGNKVIQHSLSGGGGLRQAPHSLANGKSLPLTRRLGATFGTHEFAEAQATSYA